MVALGNITFYADDPRRLSHFWADVFGYPRLDWDGPIREQQLAAGLTDDDLARRGLAEDPAGHGPRFFFHHADGRKAGRNRLHLDINATPGRRPSRDVEDTLLLVEDVHHEVAEVEKHPTGLLAPLAPKALDARFEELLLDLVRDGGDVAFVAPGDEQEDVDERQRLRDVERDEVLAVLGVCGARRDLQCVDSGG
ncbi:MAG: hypothetical protein K0Q58_982 [Microbacterium sp.]|nr:hypothetical protein [Microbacterium sp.]